MSIGFDSFMWLMKRNKDGGELDRVVDESGWKQVHGDVFRAPPRLLLFCGLIGTGSQLFSMIFCVIALTLVGEFFRGQGTVAVALLVCYSLTSFVGGYSGAAFYKRHNGPDWKRVMLLTAVLCPSACTATALLLNLVAAMSGSGQTLIFALIGGVYTLWLLVSCPLVLLGTFVGRRRAVEGDFPCRVNPLVRPIPEGKRCMQPRWFALLSGVLPFGCIFIEMSFTSFWDYKFYYITGLMLLVFCTLIMATVCVSLVVTSSLLNAEDPRWAWASFCAGGSTALYVFLYAVYYFFCKQTLLSGFSDGVYYFTCMACLCAGLFVLCGTIGFTGSSFFVRRIYQNLKHD